MSDVLEKIAASVRKQIAVDKILRPLGTEDAAPFLPRKFADAFCGPGIHIIAEIKRASPSEGDLAPDADALGVAGEYLQNGAAALSVLTEREFFKGDPAFLRSIRAAWPEAFLLMKDFVVDEYQLFRARADGADAVLLIVALLPAPERARLFRCARDLGLSVLVEVHNAAELADARALGADLIGVNNRNLKTMEVTLATSERLAPAASEAAVFVSESGLGRPADLRRLSELGYRAFLIGTEFMRSGRPGEALGELRKRLAEAT